MSGEKIGIQPMPGKDEAAFRWNWDAPLVISNHNHKRIYFAANKVFKSDDQGNTWQRISGDLTLFLDLGKEIFNACFFVSISNAVLRIEREYKCTVRNAFKLG